MDGAVLVIQFRDESTPGPPGVGVVSGQPTGISPDFSTDTQAQITAAGGVSNLAGRGNTSAGVNTPIQVPQSPAVTPPPTTPIVTPTAAASSTDPLFKTVSQLVQADPKATAEEIAKALGIQLQQATDLFKAATTPAQSFTSAPSTTTVSPPGVPDLIFPEDWKRTQEDKWLEAERDRFNSEYRAQKEREQQEALTAAEAAKKPPPPPIAEPPVFKPYRPPGQEESEGPTRADIIGVQNTIGQITNLALAGGPIGNASARAVSSVTAIPAVAEGLAAAAPALATAAPYIAAGAAIVGVPAAGLYTLNQVAQTAAGQVSGLSPEATVAEVRASIRQLMADLRTARVLGDEVGDYTSARSRLGAAFQGIRDTASEPLLKVLNDILTLSAVGAEHLEKMTEVLVGVITVAVPEVIKNIPLIGGKLDAAIKILHGLAEANKQDNIRTNNPLNFFHELPMPALPAPFTASDKQLERGDFRLEDRIPGLG